jgi:hypothetical protein
MRSPSAAAFFVVLGLVLAGLPFGLRAQFESDDFNDGNDAGWTRYSPFTPFGAPTQFFFTNGGYRIRAALSPLPAQLGPPRAGSLREGVVYTNFYISVDVVNWDDSVRQAFGLLARINNFGLGTSIGYAFTYDRGSGVTMTSGDTDLSKIVCVPNASCEFPVGFTTGPSAIHLDSTKDYRFVFIGRGPNLEGRIYELPDTVTPKVVITATDADSPYESGYCGLVVYDNTGNAPDIQPDVTFDNYYATDVEPPRIMVIDRFFGDYELTWPADASSFVLQSSTAVTGANWEDITENIVQYPDHFGYIFSVNPTGPNRFFRMIRR